jgi:hypothetical protein
MPNENPHDPQPDKLPEDEPSDDEPRPSGKSKVPESVEPLRSDSKRRRCGDQANSRNFGGDAEAIRRPPIARAAVYVHPEILQPV